MSGGNFACDYTSEEGVNVWGRIVLFGKIYNKFAEESGCAPSGRDVKWILSSLGAIAEIPHGKSNCSFPACGKVLNIRNQSKFCGACQNTLIDEERSPKKANLLIFLRQEYPDLFSRALRVMPWKLTLV
jgi:hypothetical protein